MGNTIGQNLDSSKWLEPQNRVPDFSQSPETASQDITDRIKEIRRTYRYFTSTMFPNGMGTTSSSGTAYSGETKHNFGFNPDARALNLSVENKRGDNFSLSASPNNIETSANIPVGKNLSVSGNYSNTGISAYELKNNGILPEGHPGIPLAPSAPESPANLQASAGVSLNYKKGDKTTPSCTEISCGSTYSDFGAKGPLYSLKQSLDLSERYRGSLTSTGQFSPDGNSSRSNTNLSIAPKNTNGNGFSLAAGRETSKGIFREAENQTYAVNYNNNYQNSGYSVSGSYFDNKDLRNPNLNCSGLSVTGRYRGKTVSVSDTYTATNPNDPSGKSFSNSLTVSGEIVPNFSVSGTSNISQIGNSPSVSSRTVEAEYNNNDYFAAFYSNTSDSTNTSEEKWGIRGQIRDKNSFWGVEHTEKRNPLNPELEGSETKATLNWRF